MLDVARDLLNAHGLDRVTTRMIADAAGINEGNLYYHFRTKQALHLALIDRLETEAVALLTAPRDYGSMDFFDALLRQLFGLSQAYRFLFADLHPILDAPRLRTRIRQLGTNIQRVIEQAIDELRTNAVIAVDDDVRDRLIANSWMISTYWAHYLLLHRGIRRPSPRHTEWAIAQVRFLYEPYLLERPNKSTSLSSDA